MKRDKRGGTRHRHTHVSYPCLRAYSFLAQRAFSFKKRLVMRVRRHTEQKPQACDFAGFAAPAGVRAVEMPKWLGEVVTKKSQEKLKDALLSVYAFAA